jgi:zona occludens toxin
VLFLVTGQPGNGKTLYALNHVEKLRLETGRLVYVHGVTGLTLPWLPVPLAPSGFSPKEIDKGFPAFAPDWSAIPDGAIIFLDECHKFFPPRASTTIARPYVQFLAEHRHRGFDVFLVTQGVSNVDNFLRSRVGRHFHVEATRLWQWERCADPTSKTDKKEAQSSRWSFPKDSYGWYTSSVMHTHKKNLPWKKIGIAVAAGIAFVACTGFFILHFRGHGSNGSGVGGGVAGGWGGSGNKSSMETGAAYWGVGRMERAPGVPESAPIYDSLQRVQTQPRIEGCMQMAVSNVIRCECTGVNSALLNIPLSACVNFVKRGWFDETKKYEDVKAKNVEYLNSLESGPDPVQPAPEVSQPHDSGAPSVGAPPSKSSKAGS